MVTSGLGPAVLFYSYINQLTFNINATHGIARTTCPSVCAFVKRADCDRTEDTISLVPKFLYQMS